MRAIGLVLVSLVMITSLLTDADAASNRWCASSPKRSENCGYATLDQCRAQVLGLGGWCRPKSVPRDGVWDQRHLVVRSTAPVPGRVLEVRPVVRGQFVCSFVVSMNLRQSADKQYERMAIADPLIYPHEALVGRG